MAYTVDHNLYVAKPLRNGKPYEAQRLPVTSNEDKNIVSGQAIHRYEFGITKGTFWSPKGNYLAFYYRLQCSVALALTSLFSLRILQILVLGLGNPSKNKRK